MLRVKPISRAPKRARGGSGSTLSPLASATSHSHSVQVSDARLLARRGLHILFSRGGEHTRRILAALKRAGYEPAAFGSLERNLAPAVLVSEASDRGYYVPAWVNIILNHYPVTTRNLTRDGWSRLAKQRAHILTVWRASRAECARLIERLLHGGPWR